MAHKWENLPKGKEYWDILCENDVQRKLLKRIRKNGLGKLTEMLYDDSGFRYDDDDFTEIIERIGYECGHYWQDFDDYISKGRYPDDIHPLTVKAAERWVRDAEDALGLPHKVYF